MRSCNQQKLYYCIVVRNWIFDISQSSHLHMIISSHIKTLESNQGKTYNIYFHIYFIQFVGLVFFLLPYITYMLPFILSFFHTLHFHTIPSIHPTSILYMLYFSSPTQVFLFKFSIKQNIWKVFTHSYEILFMCHILFISKSKHFNSTLVLYEYNTDIRIS